MLHFALWGTTRRFDDLEAGLAAIWRQRAVREELHALLGVLDEASETLPRPVRLAPEIPLLAHTRYSRDEILAAYALGSPARPPQVREGVKLVADAATDLLFVSLPRAGALRPIVRRPAGVVHVAAGDPDARSALRGGAQRRRGLMSPSAGRPTLHRMAHIEYIPTRLPDGTVILRAVVVRPLQRLRRLLKF
jgi:hypothetical protein